jgi:hypothetical protein
MVIKLPINKKTGVAHASNVEPVQNVIYIADRVKRQTKRSRSFASITAHPDPVKGNDILHNTLQDAVDGICKVYFETDKTRNSRHSAALIYPFRKLPTAISTNDD